MRRNFASVLVLFKYHKMIIVQKDKEQILTELNSDIGSLGKKEFNHEVQSQESIGLTSSTARQSGFMAILEKVKGSV